MILAQIPKQGSDLIESAYNVTPYGLQVYGFVVALLLVMLLALGWLYIKKDRMIQDMLKQSIEAITLFLNENSGERQKQKDEMFTSKLREMMRNIMDEKLEKIEKEVKP